MKKILNILILLLGSCVSKSSKQRAEPLLNENFCKIIRAFHQEYGGLYQTKTYHIAFGTHYFNTCFFIRPLVYTSQVALYVPFEVIKVDTLCLLVKTGHEFLFDKTLSSKDSVTLMQNLKPSTTVGFFDPIQWKCIIINKDSIMIDNRQTDPCDQKIRFKPLK